MGRTPADLREEQIRPPNGLDRLDALLQHRSRLGAMVLLSGADAISSSRLRTLLDETDGNLVRSSASWRTAGVRLGSKEFVERKPVSWYARTPGGARP